MKRSIFCSLLLLASVCAAEPFYPGLGSYQRDVSTKNKEAKRYFNQGLAFYQGFNHGAAIRAFEAAAALDPQFAMAHWGIALSLGPHINFPMVMPADAERAVREIYLAEKLKDGASPVEKDLIEALAARYAYPQPENRSSLDQLYAEAMRRVWAAHSKDPDVGALFAESLMDLRPWDQWSIDGQEEPGTKEVLETLRAVLKLNRNHPFANHLYIHAVEASPHPEWADEAANRLRKLQPGLAHNVHMPSHIDIRRGRWQQAIDTNLKAIAADEQYRKVFGPPQGFLNVYVAHNQHMLAYAAMMTGQSALAIAHMRAMVDGLPEDFLKEYAMVAEGFAAMPLEVLVRFGRWDEILAEPDAFKDYMPFSKAFRHAARAIAYAAKNDVDNARKEQSLYLDGLKAVPAEETLGNNSAAAIASVMSPMVEGEISLKEGNLTKGLASLRSAVKAEDGLRYDEPPGWLIPVRHSLGAALMNAGRFTEAEQVYRDDLAKLPENGWALFGLAESLRKQNKYPKEAAAVMARFRKIWSRADTQITSSCLCQAR